MYIFKAKIINVLILKILRETNLILVETRNAFYIYTI